MRSIDVENRQILERALVDAANDVELWLIRLFEQPDDVETMHKFRVSIRTLRGLVNFIKPFQQEKQNKRLQTNLRDAVIQTSRLRELDVLGIQIEQAAPASDPETDEAAETLEPSTRELAEHCAKLRAKELKRVRKALVSKKSVAALHTAQYDIRNIAWRNSIHAIGIPQEDIANRFQELIDKQEERLEHLDFADAKQVHEVRKKAKQVRYAATKFAPLLGEEALAVAKRMEGAQDDLGALCDARVNLQLLEAFPTKRLSPEALETLDAMKAANAALLEPLTASDEPIEEQAAEPAAEQVEPVAEPADEFVVEPVEEPVAEPAAE